MPVVGTRHTLANDTYVDQLVQNAEAVIQAALKNAPIDRHRVSIMGHSYGAAMAVMLLAHSRLFCSGVALSGAYNRTLTPFGFQYERRSLWQAPELYAAMSPLFSANRIEAPLLLFHGEADQHPATPHLQSERLFEALDVLGKTARLVSLPYEGHNLRGEESVLYAANEIGRWLEEHCGDRTR